MIILDLILFLLSALLAAAASHEGAIDGSPTEIAVFTASAVLAGLVGLWRP